MRDRLTVLEGRQVLGHIRQPYRLDKHQHNRVAVQAQGPQNTNQND